MQNLLFAEPAVTTDSQTQSETIRATGLTRPAGSFHAFPPKLTQTPKFPVERYSPIDRREPIKLKPLLPDTDAYEPPLSAPQVKLTSWVSTLGILCFEVINTLRPLNVLEPLVSEHLFEAMKARAKLTKQQLINSGAKYPRTNRNDTVHFNAAMGQPGTSYFWRAGKRPPHILIRPKTVHCVKVTDEPSGLVFYEASLVMREGTRFKAMAARVRPHRTRWQAVAIEIA